MKRRGAILLHVTWLSTALLAGVYLVTPVPFHGVSPTIQTLSTHRHWGCGQSSLTRSGTTVFYPELHATDSLRQRLREELVPQGYRELGHDGSVTFRKEVRGGLYPVHYFVLVGAKGDVCSGVSRRKWPF